MVLRWYLVPDANAPLGLKLPETETSQWYHDTAKKVYLPSVYMEAAKHLIAEGHLSKSEVPFGTDGYKAPTGDFIDGIMHDGRDPIGC